jgi:hypothetical protein
MRIIRYSVVPLAAAVLAGCSHDLTGLNTNPNSPTVAPAGALFTNAVASTVPRFAGFSANGTSLFSQHVAQVQYLDEDRGHLRSTVYDGYFAAYPAELEDFAKVIQQGDANGSPNTSGPAKVMQSWGYQNLTDVFGDVPYSEALKGDIPGGPIKPKYDTQKDIYYGVLATLTSAASTMKATGSDAGLGSADPIYKGDMSKWIKFANSLRARMALRMSKADAAKAATELTAAFAGGVMTSNSDNAQLAWPGDGVFDNPWAGTFATRDDHRVSNRLLDTMTVLNDPRIPIYAQPTKADPTKYVGLANGNDNVTVTPFFNTTSRVGAIMYPGSTTYGTFGTAAGKKTPSYMLTYAEVAFIQAEAANKGLGGLNAAQAAGFYNAGVTASITQWGGTAAQAAAYLAQPSVAYAGGATGLQQIGLQKWFSMFTQGTEAWSEWRRTGNPASIKMGPKAYADTPNIPRRFLYPAAEASSNGAALAGAIADQGPDGYYTKVWWDK